MLVMLLPGKLSPMILQFVVSESWIHLKSILPTMIEPNFYCSLQQGASSSSSSAAAVEVVEIDSGPSSAKRRATEDDAAAQETASESAQVIIQVSFTN